MENEMNNGDWIVLLAKEPVAGASKTRLARDIGDVDAQRLAEAFVLDTIETAQARPGTKLLVSHAPASARPWFEAHAPRAELHAQPDATFGPRVEAALTEAFRRGARRTVILGMDTPHLLPATLDLAFESLDGTDLCLGPSTDGGYYLLGLKRVHRELFREIPWSTSSVWATTLQRAAEQGLRVHELEPEFDVDEGADLVRLREALSHRQGLAARTRGALARLPGVGE